MSPAILKAMPPGGCPAPVRRAAACGAALLLILCTGCGWGALSIPDGAPVRIVALDPPANRIREPLAEDIRYTLRGRPDHALENNAMPARRPVLIVDQYLVDVLGDDLIYVDSRGWRYWRLPGLAAKLEAYLHPTDEPENPAAIVKPLEGDLFSPPPGRR